MAPQLPPPTIVCRHWRPCSLCHCCSSNIHSCLKNWAKTMIFYSPPWGSPLIDRGSSSLIDIYFGRRVATVCSVCRGKKCVLQKQLAQSPGHLSSIANITPPGHRVNTRPRPALAPPTQLLDITRLEYLMNILTRRVVHVLNLNTH